MDVDPRNPHHLLSAILQSGDQRLIARTIGFLEAVVAMLPRSSAGWAA